MKNRLHGSSKTAKPCTRWCPAPGCWGGGRACAKGMPRRSFVVYFGLATLALDLCAARRNFMVGPTTDGEEVSAFLGQRGWKRVTVLTWYVDGALVLVPSKRGAKAPTQEVVRSLLQIRRVPPTLTAAEYLEQAQRLGIFGTATRHLRHHRAERSQIRTPAYAHRTQHRRPISLLDNRVKN